MSSTPIPAISIQAVKEMNVLKIEEFCLENKQSLAASSSPLSEGISSAIIKSPRLCSPATASPTHRRTTGPIRRTKGGWTPEEDEKLRSAVAAFKGKSWKRIAEFFPDRSEVQCLHRWQKVLNPELVKGPWTQEEDDKIIGLVSKYGPTKWSVIARSLTGRIGKQCRERWHNHLNPDIRKDAWTLEEELLLMNAHQTHGNKWAEIAKVLPGRTHNSIKNHWNSSLKKKLNFDLASGKLPPVPRNGIQNGPKFVNKPSLMETIREPYSAAAQTSSGTTDVYKLETDGKDLDMAASSSGLPNESTDSEGIECKPWPSHVASCDRQLELLEKCQNGERNYEIGEGKVKSQLQFETPPYGSRYYEPPQIETCVPPELDHLNRHHPQQEYNSSPASSPVNFSTPPSTESSSLSVQSPESVLRLAAKSYLNTPSIFRKRKTVSQVSVFPGNIEKVCKQMVYNTFQFSDENARFQNASTGFQDESSDEACQDDGSSMIPNGKAFNASPPYQLRSKRTPIFVERQLSFTFDKEKH
ncbi:hypothetical protein K2173_019422 [Erythroxylum novogranatense]|uniref:Uncharacterized protein n=1 Tax=Erythroxylum novogranatense TaxID=1862640 RepID=A0AAV8UF70_9ROSI|nr:hypothetical protein K2173_019422 [Erythroxylum novogranatense]